MGGAAISRFYNVSYFDGEKDVTARYEIDFLEDGVRIETGPRWHQPTVYVTQVYKHRDELPGEARAELVEERALRPGRRIEPPDAR